VDSLTETGYCIHLNLALTLALTLTLTLILMPNLTGAYAILAQDSDFCVIKGP